MTRTQGAVARLEGASPQCPQMGIAPEVGPRMSPAGADAEEGLGSLCSPGSQDRACPLVLWSTEL